MSGLQYLCLYCFYVLITNTVKTCFFNTVRKKSVRHSPSSYQDRKADTYCHVIIQSSGFSLKLLSQTLQCQLLVSISCSLFSLAEPALLKDQSGHSALEHQDKKSTDAATAVVGTSLPLPVPNKPESVVSITSQCSYSSTIVHVGDKKPQPESGTVP